MRAGSRDPGSGLPGTFLPRILPYWKLLLKLCTLLLPWQREAVKTERKEGGPAHSRADAERRPRERRKSSLLPAFCNKLES